MLTYSLLANYEVCIVKADIINISLSIYLIIMVMRIVNKSYLCSYSIVWL